MNDNWGLSDEELDGLFRQAADGQRPRFDPEDWRQMAARLDAAPDGAAAPRANPWWRRSWWLLAGLLLFTGAGVAWWATVPHSGKTNPRTERMATEKTLGEAPAVASSPAPGGVGTVPKPAAPTNSKRSESGNEGVVETAPNATRSTTEARAERPEGATASQTRAKTSGGAAPSLLPAGNGVDAGVTTGKNRLAVRPSRAADAPKSDVKKARTTEPGARASEAGTPSERTTLPSVVSARSGGRARSWVPAGGLKRGDGRANPAKTLPGTDGQVTRHHQLEQSGVRVVQRTNAGSMRPVVSQPGGTDVTTPAAPNESVAAEARVAFNVSALKPHAIFPKKAFKTAWPDELVAPADTLERRVKLPPVPRGRFGLRAVLSPDLNSVGNFKPSAFGNSYGLLAEYEFLPRWRVQTGVIRSQKDYSASTYEYAFKTGYWAQLGHPRPDEVDARCALFDVPINLRYDVLRRGRWDVFVNAGVSTYLMRDEKYLYRYANNPKYIVRDTVQNGGGHFANTLNFSVGYQRQLGEGFSLQIEPYLKLPLATVGFGSVRLYSLGMHLSLAFHPLRRSPVGR